jgi:hypothetical protein
VVVYASYISQKGSLVLGQPLLVLSRPPPSAPTGIDLGQSSFVLAIGDTMPVFLSADYPDGSRIPQFVGVDETVGYTSSNSSIVQVDPDHDSIIAKAAGTATVTVTFHGFTTQVTVTVNLIAPPPGIPKHPARMQVLNGDNVLMAALSLLARSKEGLYCGIIILGRCGVSGYLSIPILNFTVRLAS